MGAEEQDLAKSMVSIFSQSQSAKAERSEQLSEAVQLSGEVVSPTPENLLATELPLHSCAEAASSRSNSLSPQPSLELHEGMSQGQQLQHLSSQAAPVAQAAGPAAQDDDTWQEVRGHRRKSARQQRATNPGAHRAPKQGREAPDQELQAAAQHAEQARRRSAVAPSADPEHESLLSWLSALSTGGTPEPQQTSRCEGLQSLQSLQPQPARPQPAICVTAQHRPLRTPPDSSFQDGAHAAPQHMLHSSGPFLEMPSQEQVRLTGLMGVACLQQL